MPNKCCIKNCNNTNDKGYHLFQFPMKRPDMLQIWMNAIRRDFIPKKSHVVCSAHFLPSDILQKANASGVVLKHLAVPSIFLEAPASNNTPIISKCNPPMESESTPTMESECDSPMESEYNPPVESECNPPMESECNPPMKSDCTPPMECVTPAISAMTNVPPIVWKSILKSNKDNTTVSASISSPKAQSATNNTIKLTMRKQKTVMHSSVLKLKQQMSPREQHMWRTIKTLKQKLRRKEEKINSLQYLLTTLREKNLLGRDPSEVISTNFDERVDEVFKNEWNNRNGKKKGCRYSDEIKKFAVTLHFYSPKAYNYYRFYICHMKAASEIDFSRLMRNLVF
ncbi:THAP domain-containing protein 1 isoform X2 [Ooceraea biroi]|uniref:THAP domain-containing protein 1 isoform X2 n=1 Tax=Ooceraea biroi TaxID=2015173 RepID=UPI000F096752|nr:THAP domain-containing protein 1 isoform X2 [Ooceraea biroi]